MPHIEIFFSPGACSRATLIALEEAAHAQRMQERPSVARALARELAPLN